MNGNRARRHADPDLPFPIAASATLRLLVALFVCSGGGCGMAGFGGHAESEPAVDAAGAGGSFDQVADGMAAAPASDFAGACAAGWDAGVAGGIPDWPDADAVTDFGAVAGDGKDDAVAFQKAIDAAPPEHAVRVPAGVFDLRRPLRMRSGVVLRGAGSEHTRLRVDHDGNAIVFSGEAGAGDWVDAVAGYTEGSTRLQLEDSPGFRAGDYGIIRQANDTERMYTRWYWNQEWAQSVVGQVFRVADADDAQLELVEPLNIDFAEDLDPEVRMLPVIRNAGVERLAIRREGDADAFTFAIDAGANIWLRDIRSRRAAKAHVYVTRSHRCEIRDSGFDDASDHGDGGHGYGVMLTDQTSACLVENNGFRRLRHAMLVSRGANGNMFGYNESRAPLADEGFPPADISLHGHQPFRNLFEGNVVQKVHIGDYWGPAGPWNTFLRNRIESGGLRVDDHSDRQHIIGNVLLRRGIHVDDSVNAASLTLKGNGSASDDHLPGSCYRR